MPARVVWRDGTFSITEVTWVFRDRPTKTTYHVAELYKNPSTDYRASWHQVGDGHRTLDEAQAAVQALQNERQDA